MEPPTSTGSGASLTDTPRSAWAFVQFGRRSTARVVASPWASVTVRVARKK